MGCPVVHFFSDDIHLSVTVVGLLSQLGVSLGGEVDPLLNIMFLKMLRLSSIALPFGTLVLF